MNDELLIVVKRVHSLMKRVEELEEENNHRKKETDLLLEAVHLIRVKLEQLKD